MKRGIDEVLMKKRALLTNRICLLIYALTAKIGEGGAGSDFFRANG